MHTTDWIDLGAELLPRRVRRTVGIVLALLLATGAGTPVVLWYVETKAAELTQDLTPVLTSPVVSSTSSVRP